MPKELLYRLNLWIVSKKEFKGLVIQTAMNAEATSPLVSLVDSQS